MENLAFLASVYSRAYKTMLQEIQEREAAEGIEGFYPLCTTSINITKRICDVLQLSEKRKRACPACSTVTDGCLCWQLPFHSSR